ncbi:hypothetical protein C8R45DRAFT_982680 [Mycena sanguinolenta]|nr:hypothetical protein C8R45DRAFT_982680 [Mycena sanguinolenta]
MSQPPTLPAALDAPSLPPEIVRQVQVASLVFAGTTAVLIWDIFHHLVDDYYLLFKHKFRLSAAAYLVSRTASLIYVLGFTLFATYPLRNCYAFEIAFDSFYPASTGATSLLFFIRVRAVYGGQRFVTYFFGFLWISVVVMSILVPIGTDSTKFGSSCIVTKIHSWVGAPGIVLTVHDTSVFAISYRLLSNSHVEYTAGQRVGAFFRGANLHAFSKVLFRDGQLYYMLAGFMNVTVVCLVSSPHVSPVYQGMIAIPNIALTSIMACRVYRNAKLHYMHILQMSMPTLGDSVMQTTRFTMPIDPQSASADLAPPQPGVTSFPVNPSSLETCSDSSPIIKPDRIGSTIEQ